MEYQHLGQSNIKASKLGFGCCPMGGHGWGEVEDNELDKAVKTSLELGVNFFDTADIYGLGRSEEILGKALKNKRDQAVIASKFGVRIDNNGKTVHDNSIEWIQQALEQSLSRINTEYIDLYQIHYWDRKTELGEIFSFLEDKVTEGKIRAFGLSNISDIPPDRLPESKNLVSFQEEFSLAKRDKETEIKQLTQNRKLSFLSWGSLGQGVLSGKYNRKTQFGEDDRRSREIYVNFHGPKFETNMKIVDALASIATLNDKAIGQVAIRWIQDYLNSTITLVGIKSEAQLIENANSFGWKLQDEEIEILEKISIPPTEE